MTAATMKKCEENCGQDAGTNSVGISRPRDEENRQDRAERFSSFEVLLALPLLRPDNHAMPRTARVARGGYCYHVVNRGNGRRTVCHDDDDYAFFAALLRAACARVPMRVLAYGLMPNHCSPTG